MTTNTIKLAPIYLPYAKTNLANPIEVHLLLYHLIDVGQVASVVWTEVFTEGTRQRISSLLRLSSDKCGRLLSFLAAAHDLGKAGPSYQRKYGPDWLCQALTNAGFELHGSGKAYDPHLPHGTVSAWALETLLTQQLSIDKRLAYRLAVAVGGHHGIWPQLESLKHITDSQIWSDLRASLLAELVRVFDPPGAVAMPARPTDTNAVLTILSGLTSVADWIGSQNDQFFGYWQEPMRAEAYAERARAVAYKALQELGWLGWHSNGGVRTFAEVFAYLGIDAPRPVQQQVIDLAVPQDGPTLLVIEAPTGIGKTELALYIADRWLQQTEGRGLYVAMPTQATSNQMYSRVGEFLHQRYPDAHVNFHLVHGQAAFQDDLRRQVELQGVGDDGEAHLAAEAWFFPRKRTLLAPFGVGTVDQALLGVLQTKHFFVRLFGLSHKVVIFDEVHAYDTYMNTIFQLLLTWLGAIGTSVIILSATLPNSTRRTLVQAYTGKEHVAAESLYPALTLANGQRQETVQLPKPPSYTLQIAWCEDRAAEATARFLVKELAEGGYAVVICNTVRRAQAVYRALDKARQCGELDIAVEDLVLFHAAYPPVWRKKIEHWVLRKFGKGGERTGRAIVVATQVIEQSLDLDFDLMVSDLAPIDLLLQRAGRLHRHVVNDGRRHGLSRRLVVLQPERDGTSAPFFGRDTIYTPYILLRTYCVLHDKDAIQIPEQVSPLIEAVYDSEQELTKLAQGVTADQLDYLRQKMDDDHREAQNKAGTRLVLAPQERRLLNHASLGLEEEDPQAHKQLQAKTRDIDFSITVICLHQDDTGVYLFTDEGKKMYLDLAAEPTHPMVKALLENAIVLQNRTVGNYFLAQEVPQPWRNHAGLRYCRYAIFVNGRCELPNRTLQLTRTMGLEIQPEEA